MTSNDFAWGIVYLHTRMLYPEDHAKAKLTADAFTDAHAGQAASAIVHDHISNRIITETTVKHGSLAGGVLLMLLELREAGEYVSLNAAYELVSERWSGKKADANSVKRQFLRHRNNAHLWAARGAILHLGEPALLPFPPKGYISDMTPNGFRVFVEYANGWRQFGETLQLGPRKDEFALYQDQTTKIRRRR